MGDRSGQLVLSFLLCAVAALCYLEWWRQGELQFLNERVDELESKRRQRATRAKTVASP